MDWIKRNLIFVVGAVVALALLGVAGWYSYSGYSHNATQWEQLNQQYEELKRLTNLKPNPGDGKKVDNIRLAQEQEKEAQAFLDKLTQRLQRIPALPEGTNLAASDYSAALQRTIDELQREATNSSVVLPPKYKFSFEAQAGRVTFAAGSLVPLAAQLGEVKAICTILNQAKINALDGLRRERVSADDNSGPATDYLEVHSVTNDLAISAPYEVTIRCFTPELAAVLAGFANSPYGLVVKGVNLEPAGVTVADPYGTPPVTPMAVAVPVPGQPEGRRSGEGEAFRSRYGRRAMAPPPTPMPAPAPIPLPVAGAAPVRAGLQTFLTEKQLKVTLLIHVVKLLPQT
jgi:hypothetical protein